MNPADTSAAPFASVIIRLLQGVVYEDDTTQWKNLITYQDAVSDYFARIGIELIIHSADGFALIRQPERSDDSGEHLPRLIKKSPLTYRQTILCVILRESLEEFDAKPSESASHYVSSREIKDKLELFFKGHTNRVKLLEGFDETIQSLIKLDVLKLRKEDPLNPDETVYEVRRAIKALMNNERLGEIKQKLNDHLDNHEQSE